MFSALAPKADSKRTSLEVRFVPPIAAIGTAHMGWYSLRRPTR
jgi:hypothetical protein